MDKPHIKVGTATFYFIDEEQKRRFQKTYCRNGKWLVGFEYKTGNKIFINGAEKKG